MCIGSVVTHRRYAGGMNQQDHRQPFRVCRVMRCGSGAHQEGVRPTVLNGPFTVMFVLLTNNSEQPIGTRIFGR